MKKFCPSCRLYLSSQEFRKSSKSIDGLSLKCLKCQRSQEFVINPNAHQNRKMRRRNMKTRRVQALETKYGINEFEWAEMLQRQGNLCAICGGKDAGKVLCVDHNHSSGKVRGLLCGNCNVGLGNFKDNPKILESAITYLLEKGYDSKE